MHRLATLLLALFLVADARAATLRVPGDFRTIQPAINAAAGGDTVRVAPGIYQGPGNRDLLLEGKSIVLVGAGPGATLIDCEGAGRGFFLVDADAGTLLRGFTVLNGLAPEGDLPGKGGGALVIGGAPRFERCLFLGGRADFGGGLAAEWGARLAVRDCSFRDNRAGIDGDDLHLFDAELVR